MHCTSTSAINSITSPLDKIREVHSLHAFQRNMQVMLTRTSHSVAYKSTLFPSNCPIARSALVTFQNFYTKDSHHCLLKQDLKCPRTKRRDWYSSAAELLPTIFNFADSTSTINSFTFLLKIILSYLTADHIQRVLNVNCISKGIILFPHEYEKQPRESDNKTCLVSNTVALLATSGG